MSFFKNKGQEGKVGPVWVWVPVEGRGHKEKVKEDECGGHTMYSCIKMEKMRPVENILRRRERDKGE
jgi:hypothetical protein